MATRTVETYIDSKLVDTEEVEVSDGMEAHERERLEMRRILDRPDRDITRAELKLLTLELARRLL